MIDYSKRNVCDSCDALSSQKNPVSTYTFTLFSNEKVVHAL